MKFFFLVVLTFVALSASVSTNAADLLAAPPVQESRLVGANLPFAPTSKTDVPICYVQWANNDRLADLTQFCGKQPKEFSRSQITYPKPPTPYDQSAIKKFDDSVYGKGN